MNEAEEARRIRRMRAKAVQLEADAERTGDPEERERLHQRARKMEFDCEQESMMAAGDIYPTE